MIKDLVRTGGRYFLACGNRDSQTKQKKEFVVTSCIVQKMFKLLEICDLRITTLIFHDKQNP